MGIKIKKSAKNVKKVAKKVGGAVKKAVKKVAEGAVPPPPPPVVRKVVEELTKDQAAAWKRVQAAQAAAAELPRLIGEFRHALGAPTFLDPDSGEKLSVMCRGKSWFIRAGRGE